MFSTERHLKNIIEFIEKSILFVFYFIALFFMCSYKMWLLRCCYGAAKLFEVVSGIAKWSPGGSEWLLCSYLFAKENVKPQDWFMCVYVY